MTRDDGRVEEGNVPGDDSMGVKPREWLLVGKRLRKIGLKGFEVESCHLVAHELPVGFIFLCGSLNGGCVVERFIWYPAPNLDRALAPSLVGRFSCLKPLLRLVIRGSPSCSGSSPSLHPTSVPFWGLRCYWLPMPCLHLPSLMNFVNSTRRSLVARFRTPRSPKTGPPTRICLPIAH